jgi:anti-sigma regulatory factor (Ser/Thr protein kinase)
MVWTLVVGQCGHHLLVSEARSAAFPASAASPRAARRFVRDVLPVLPDPESSDTVMLLVTEIVTNAVVHARSPVRVAVMVDDSQVRVEVRDDAPQLPVLRPAAEEAFNGRGLLLLDRLSTQWGVEGDGYGKTVWFEIEFEGRRPQMM